MMAGLQLFLDTWVPDYGVIHLVVLGGSGFVINILTELLENYATVGMELVPTRINYFLCLDERAIQQSLEPFLAGCKVASIFYSLSRLAELRKDGKPVTLNGVAKCVLYTQSAVKTDYIFQITAVAESGKSLTFVNPEFRSLVDASRVFEKLRVNTRFLNPIDGSLNPISPELLNDYDSVGEVLLWSIYLQRIGGPDNTLSRENVVRLSQWVTTTLNDRTLDVRRKE